MADDGRLARVLRDPVLAGAVLVVAVAVGALVWVVRAGAAGEPADHAPVDPAGVPTALPNGKPLPAVPPGLREAFDRPVVLVAEEEERASDLDRCGRDVEWEYPPTLRSSIVTPEGLSVAVRGEEAGTGVSFHVACYAVWDGSGWTTWASWIGEVADPEGPAGPMDPACCRADGSAVGGAELETPEGAVWAAQDRGAYWLAYPIQDGLVQPVWLVGEEGATPEIVYVDAAGARIGQAGPGEGDAPPEPQG